MRHMSRSWRPQTPHRMGAALTYARRYALFTLVGILVKTMWMRRISRSPLRKQKS